MSTPSNPSARRGRVCFRVAAAVATATLAMVATSSPAGAVTGNQTVTAATSATGTLSIAAPSAINLGNSLAPGSTVSAFAFGSLSWTDTLNDATASSVTLAATDLYNSPSKLIPFTNFSIGVGQTINTQAGNTGSTPTAGAAGPTALAGADTTPGTTFSSPGLTLASGSTTTEGTWTQPGNTITVQVPASLINSGALTATVQYTVTG